MKTILLYFVLLSTLTLFSQTQIGSVIEGEAAGDRSGYSVSISSDGSIIAIGAPRNDGNGDDSGHARVYQNNSGIWTQIGADIDGEATGDESGFSVSLSSDGNTLAVGATLNDGVTGENSGHVRVYQNISGVWTQIGTDIDGEATWDQSGDYISLSSDGTTVAIGAHEHGGYQGKGHVRVYKNISGVWTQIGADIDGEGADDDSGKSVSLSSDGNIVAIGANFNDGNGADSGHVRIYQNISNVWTQIGTDINGEAAGDASGASVSLSSDGSVVAIGAYGNSDNGAQSGHVRIYKNISGVWTQIGADIDGEAAGDLSGDSVSLSSNGNIVAIGARANSQNGYGSGHVRIYQNISGIWTQIGSDIDGEAAGYTLGFSVSLSADGSTVVSGGPWQDGVNGSNTGHARIFDLSAILIVENKEVNNSFSFYPNPAKNTVNLHIENSLEFKNASIYNCFGQLVQQSKTSKIDVSALASGLYFIEVETNKGKGVKKFIKQ